MLFLHRVETLLMNKSVLRTISQMADVGPHSFFLADAQPELELISQRLMYSTYLRACSVVKEDYGGSIQSHPLITFECVPVKICFRRSLQKLAQTRVFHPVRPGYWVQFSTSNNSTSLFDHWLLYRHCAKLNLPAPTDGPLDSHQNHIFGEKERYTTLVVIKSCLYNVQAFIISIFVYVLYIEAMSHHL